MKSYLRNFGVLFVLLFTALLIAPAQTHAQTSTPPIAPTTATVQLGQSVILSLTVEGSLPFTYQWRKNGVNIAGATKATLPFPALALADIGTYSCVVTNSAGSTTTNDGILSISLIPPANGVLIFTPGLVPPATSAK